MTGAADRRGRPSGTLRFAGLPARDKDVEIWLPHDETTELVALRDRRAGACPEAVPGPAALAPPRQLDQPRLQRGEPERPRGRPWPRPTAGVELVNLGLGGSALLDPFTARTMRDTPADLVSVKIGINLVNSDQMRMRAFGAAVHGFLDTIREGHPDTPLLVVSPDPAARSTSTPPVRARPT